MNTLYNRIKHIGLKSILLTLPLVGVGGGLASCSDMLTNDSELVEFSEDNTLNHAKDTISSVMGIINKMQVIADRTYILGDVRSDLFSATDKASKDIKQLSSFSVEDGNAYNQISDYYAVINNCNYFLQTADTALSHLGKKVFAKEYAVVKAYRAWTYLQAAKVYGKVPLMLTAALTEEQAQQAVNMEYSDITAICNYFIDDIKPYVDAEQPDYGTVYGNDSRKYFIPVRALLGEMCLWAGRYQEAAQYFHDYLTQRDNVIPVSTGNASWHLGSDYDFTTGGITESSYYSSVNSTSEILAMIPMETSEFNGVKTMLEDVYSSTLNNNYYAQVIPSIAYDTLSYRQSYCIEREIDASTKDTIYAPKTGLRKDIYAGDLRLCSSYSSDHVNRSETSLYSPEIVSVTKLTGNSITMYRRQQVYLMFAEALNRLGLPHSAFCVLKYGLRDTNIKKYIPEAERTKAGSLLSFDDEKFLEYNTQGIHHRGCGDVDCDSTYCVPEPKTALASYNDTVQYQIPLVEDYIITEMALEEAYEGQRFFNLMRVALRRNDPSYLALPVSMRTGTKNQSLYSLLMDQTNWYLPIE